jgi:hypothetical protein
MCIVYTKELGYQHKQPSHVYIQARSSTQQREIALLDTPQNHRQYKSETIGGSTCSINKKSHKRTTRLHSKPIHHFGQRQPIRQLSVTLPLRLARAPQLRTRQLLIHFF